MINLMQKTTYAILVNDTVIFCKYDNVSVDVYSDSCKIVFHFTSTENNSFHKKGDEIRFYQNDFGTIVKHITPVV